jgi:hypothetical protein
VALVHERPGITKPEPRDAAGLSSAGMAQTCGQVREEALPGGATGDRIAHDQAAPSASEGETGQYARLPPAYADRSEFRCAKSGRDALADRWWPRRLVSLTDVR